MLALLRIILQSVFLTWYFSLVLESFYILHSMCLTFYRVHVIIFLYSQALRLSLNKCMNSVVCTVFAGRRTTNVGR